MNAARRKAISVIYDDLQSIKERIESIRDEEQEAHDNLPDSLQYGEKGEAMQESADTIDSAVSDIDQVLESLESIIQQ